MRSKAEKFADGIKNVRGIDGKGGGHDRGKPVVLPWSNKERE